MTDTKTQYTFKERYETGNKGSTIENAIFNVINENRERKNVIWILKFKAYRVVYSLGAF